MNNRNILHVFLQNIGITKKFSLINLYNFICKLKMLHYKVNRNNLII